jgi:hypothetical protein
VTRSALLQLQPAGGYCAERLDLPTAPASAPTAAGSDRAGPIRYPAVALVACGLWPGDEWVWVM